MGDSKQLWEPSAKEKLDWLGQCSVIDTSGMDGGWAFTYMYWGQDDGVGPVDVRLSTRGYQKLGDAVTHAMRYERGVGGK